MPVKKAATKPAKKASTRPAKKSDAPTGAAATKLIDRHIQALADWRGRTLEKMRRLIHRADPGVVEEWKWGIPVWSHDGLICTGETYKAYVKLTFAKGASLEDPAGLFTSSLEGKVRRAVDIRESDRIDEAAFQDLVRAAVLLNLSGAKRKK